MANRSPGASSPVDDRRARRLNGEGRLLVWSYSVIHLAQHFEADGDYPRVARGLEEKLSDHDLLSRRTAHATVATAVILIASLLS